MLKLGGLGKKLVHAFLMGFQGICFNVDVKLKMKKNTINLFVKLLIVQIIHL